MGNYKWNIDLEKGTQIAKETIIEIIKENNYLIDFNKLIILLNQRTKYLNLKNNNIKRTITNFLKYNYKGTLHFIETIEDIFIENGKQTDNGNKTDSGKQIESGKQTFIRYNDKTKLFHEFDDWIFINEDNIVS